MGKRTHRRITGQFKECINTSGLADLEATGCFYSWINKQRGEERVYVNLDRASVNQKWVENLENSEVMFFPEGMFDHSPMIVSFYLQQQIARRPFRYFVMWKMAKKYKSKVVESRGNKINGVPMYCLTEKLKRLKGVLKEMN